MRTPSLSRRVVAVGVGVVAVLALGLDALLYLSVRSVAADRTGAALDNQVALANAAVRAEGPDPSATALVGRLSELEVNATVRVGDGPVLRTGVTGGAGLTSRELDIAPGTLVRVFAPSPDADPKLRRLLLYELAVTPMLIVLAAVLLRMVAEVAMRPVEEIAAAARRTASGRRGERLRPDRPDTRLGQIALTYDTMLDALEGALAEARAAGVENARLATIVEAIDRAVLSTDLDGIVRSWNPGAERMYGFTAEEAVGADLAELIVPDAELADHRRALATVARGEVVESAHLVRRRRDGTAIDTAHSVSPLRRTDGAVNGASFLEKDVTEERSTAAQLAASRAALERALEEAHLSEASTRRFLDDAAHQLRTPITSIRASAETLQRSLTPAQREALLAAVVRESERAGRLMAGLLRMARLDHAPSLHPRPTDLAALCRDEAEQAGLDRSGVRVDVRTEGVGPIGPAVVDADAVAEILANLVDNARRHARSRIGVVVARDEAEVTIRVTDDGPGLPAGQSEHAFERFVSLDARGGSGLGLSIARGLARAHGGDLTYDGRSFVLRLPHQGAPAGASR